MKNNINIQNLLKRLNKSKVLAEMALNDLSRKYIEAKKEKMSAIILLDWEYEDVIDYSSLIFDEVVGKLCEYLKDREQGNNPKYKKLYDMRNERWHCDDDIKIKNDFSYVESIINEWIRKPLSNQEINHIKDEQIKFGEKI